MTNPQQPPGAGGGLNQAMGGMNLGGGGMKQQQQPHSALGPSV